jgi:biopolymer transport protein TolQ
MNFLDIVKYAFFQSDECGKAIVVVLGCLSVFCWSTMLEKAWLLYKLKQSCENFRKRFESVRSPLEMFSQVESFDGPMKELYNVGIQELLAILDPDNKAKGQILRHNYLPKTLDKAELEKIRSLMNRTLSRQTSELEETMTMLGTAVAVSPLLGLFGTVWGVMATFIGIARAGRPDLMAIAPGISGALLTTVAGLVVAVPAAVGCNLINSCIENVCTSLEDFIENFLAGLGLTNTPPQSATTPAPAVVQEAPAQTAVPRQSQSGRPEFRPARTEDEFGS